MFKFRVRVVMIVVFGGLLMVSTRLFYLQVVRGDHYQAYAENVSLSRRVTEAVRGRIFAAGGELLAHSSPSYDVAFVPRHLPEGRSLSRPVLKLYQLGRREQLERVRDVTVMVSGGSGGQPYEVTFGLAATFLRRQGPELAPRQENGRAGVRVPEELAELLGKVSALAGVSEEELLRELFEGLALVGRRWRGLSDPCVVARDVEFLAAAEIESHPDRYPGVRIVESAKRSCPYEDTACHVLGYVQGVTAAEYERWRGEYGGSRAKRFFPNDEIGRCGVESKCDLQMRPSRGMRVLEVDAARHTQEVLEEEPPVPGADVHLTLDLELQTAAERALKGRVGSLVFLEPKTGRVLALASSPGYNANDLRKSPPDPHDELRPMLNRAIQGQYPLGSSFKLLVATAALQEGRWFRQVLCTGRYHGSECNNHRRPLVVSFHDSIKRSCNVYYYRTAQELLGIRRLTKWAKAFGFGQRTGVGLAGEEDGLLPTPEWKRRRFGEGWYPGDTRNLAIGQGALLVTPLQVARFIAALANGGRLVRPRIVDRYVAADGSVETVGVEARDLRLTPGILSKLHRAMRGVCHEMGGTARRAWSGWIDEMGYAVAGKTSTADSWIRRKPHNVGWFNGFAPSHDPRVVFVVCLEHELVPGEPRPHGGDVAAPIARRVLAALPERYLKGIPGRARRDACRARMAGEAAAAAAQGPPEPPDASRQPREVAP